MPTLYILAGPNGTGKTTYYETANAVGFIDPALPFVNVDLITRALPGGYMAKNFARADEIARMEIDSHLSAMRDFMIEKQSRYPKGLRLDKIHDKEGLRGSAFLFVYIARCDKYQQGAKAGG